MDSTSQAAWERIPSPIPMTNAKTAKSHDPHPPRHGGASTIDRSSQARFVATFPVQVADMLDNTQSRHSAVARLCELWQQGQRPELPYVLAEFGSLPAAQLVEIVAVDQPARWRSGEKVPVERYLAAWPVLADDNDLALEVIFG